MELEKYQKKELKQHIYDTPDTYVGGSDLIDDILPIFNDNKINIKTISYIPALYNIFNEILVNARDQRIRLQGLKGVPQVTSLKSRDSTEKSKIRIKYIFGNFLKLLRRFFSKMVQIRVCLLKTHFLHSLDT